MYALVGGEGVKPLVHFHCVSYINKLNKENIKEKRGMGGGGGGPGSM